jgi:hypothetical protein
MRYELTDFEWAAIKPMLPNKPAAFRDVLLAAAIVRCIREDLAAGRRRASVDRKAAPVADGWEPLVAR